MRSYFRTIMGWQSSFRAPTLFGQTWVSFAYMTSGRIKHHYLLASVYRRER